MFGLKIYVRVQTFRRVPPVLPCNFCHPGPMWLFFEDPNSKLLYVVSVADVDAEERVDENLVEILDLNLGYDVENNQHLSFAVVKSTLCDLLLCQHSDNDEWITYFDEGVNSTLAPL